MAFKCGHCGSKHDTIAEGRECAAKAGDDIPATPDFIKAEVDAQPGHMRPNAQKFLADLLRQFGVKLADDMTPETVDWQTGKKVLHGLIDARRLKATGQVYTMPDGIVFDPHAKSVHSGERRPTQRIPLPDCEPGYYAVLGWKPDHEAIKFFWVKTKKKGEYAGQTFLDEIIGGHSPIKRGGRYAIEAIEQIKSFGLEEAGALFATELKSCCKCRKHLTKKASRIIHMGRHCAYQNGRGEDWDALNWKYNDADAEDDD